MSGTSRFVAYERGSIKRWGTSGLGPAAKRRAIDDLVASGGAEVIGRFAEVRAAGLPLLLAKLTVATLLKAKLDRLAQRGPLKLRGSGGRFVAADMPEANDLTIGIMAQVAKQQRDAASRRTRRRWCRQGAGRGRITPTAQRPSGGLERVDSPSGRPLRGTPIGTPRT